jgi:hypothetical protein
MTAQILLSFLITFIVITIAFSVGIHYIVAKNSEPRDQSYD